MFSKCKLFEQVRKKLLTCRVGKDKLIRGIACWRNPPTQQNRKIRIAVSFTNPSSYYTGKLTGPGLAASGITNSYSTTQDVTYSMFKTTRKYTFVVTGADGTSKTVSKEVYIEPGGVGIWHRQNNQAKECFHVYYKNELGEIIEATEAWYRRNSQNIQTIK